MIRVIIRDKRCLSQINLLYFRVLNFLIRLNQIVWTMESSSWFEIENEHDWGSANLGCLEKFNDEMYDKENEALGCLVN